MSLKGTIFFYLKSAVTKTCSSSLDVPMMGIRVPSMAQTTLGNFATHKKSSLVWRISSSSIRKVIMSRASTTTGGKSRRCKQTQTGSLLWKKLSELSTPVKINSHVLMLCLFGFKLNNSFNEYRYMFLSFLWYRQISANMQGILYYPLAYLKCKIINQCRRPHKCNFTFTRATLFYYLIH